jgi:hypothetical protein
MTEHNRYTRRQVLVPGLAAATAAMLPDSLVRAAATDTLPLFNGVMQFAYIVPDIHQAMADWTARLGIGPWFLNEPFDPPQTFYRGQPSRPPINLAMTYSGAMNIELIQPLDETPSVYRETLLKKGYGFHHWGLAVDDLSAALQVYLDDGYEEAHRVVLDGGNQVIYVDTTRDLPGMIELIEITDGVRVAFGNMHQIAENWDGKDLIFGG